MCISEHIDLPFAEEDVDYGMVNNLDQPQIGDNVNADLVAARGIQQQIIQTHFV